MTKSAVEVLRVYEMNSEMILVEPFLVEIDVLCEFVLHFFLLVLVFDGKFNRAVFLLK